jgi:hypothetical protein
MEIRVSLNVQAENSADIRTQLDTELHGLERPGLQIATQQKEVEAGALGVFEAYQFILACGPAIATTIPLITAVLQLSNAVLQRRGLKRQPKVKKPKSGRGSEPSPSHPLVVVHVDGKSIELPAKDPQLKRYVNSITKPQARLSSSSTIGRHSRGNKPKAPKRKASTK